jgi:hypothetical protein
MKKSAYIFLIVLALPIYLYSQTFDVVTILDNGASDKRINFVYLGDGYTTSEQTDFVNDAQNTVNEQFNTSPYKEYKNFFNAYAIKVISNESGVDHPTIAGNPNCNSVPKMSKDTYFDSTFDYAGIHRLLVPVAYSKIYSVLADNTPFYDQANIIVNTPYYGGSGGYFAAASTHASSNQIMIHEIGHSFVDLADEYWAGSTYASKSANMTQESNTAEVRWKNWVGSEGIDVYPYGNTAPQNTWFRPHQNCIMRFLGEPLCAVCREATIDRIYTLQPPIESFLPNDNDVSYGGTDLNFSVDLILPDPNTLEIEWLFDGESFATDVTNVVITNAEITEESHELTVKVEDTTTLSRTYTFAEGYVFTVSWNITDNSSGVSENSIKTFIFKIYPNPVQDQLSLNYTASNITDSFEINLVDLQGKVIHNQDFNPMDGTHQLLIDIRDVSSGIYVLNIKTNDFQKSYKFIKN